LVVIVSLAIAVASLSSKFSVPQPLSRSLDPPQPPLKFSWSNCGSTSDPISVQSLQVGPDPVVLGQNITVSFKGSFGQTIVSGASAKVKMWKKIFGVWTDIPCVDNVGSCNYADFCSLFKNPNCGPILTEYKIPCHCPFTAGSYSLPTVSVKTKDPGWEWLTSGDFSAQGELYDASGNRLGCYLVYITLGN